MAILIQDRPSAAQGAAAGPQLHSAACESSSWASSARCCSRRPGGSSGGAVRRAGSYDAAAAAPRVHPARRLAAPREQDPGTRLLPELDARPARAADRQPLEQHRLRRQGPQLPRELGLAGGGRPQHAGDPRHPPRLPGADGDPEDLPGRDDGERQDVPEEDRVLPGSAWHLALDERDHGDDVHRQPRRRLLARPLRLAPRGLALHAQRARRAAADVREGRRQPEAHAQRARARPATT